MSEVDVLIPTCGRPCALAMTLTSLSAQTFRGFRAVVSDQGDGGGGAAAREVQAAARILRAHGNAVEFHSHLPRRGLAEQRQFLLDRAEAPRVLFLDDDLVLEPWVLEMMLGAIREAGCGFVGCAPIGLSFAADVRPDEQAVEFWDGAVMPETVRPGSPQWERHRLHNAANVYHVQERLAIRPAGPRAYRVAWVGGCVLYDAGKLRAAGGFGFWRKLPADHCGEDVLAQLAVMARWGGCGLLPSGVYHLELPTTVADRRVDAPHALDLDEVLP